MNIPKFRAWITYGYTEEDLKNPDMAEEIQETGLGFMDTPDLIDLNNERIKYDCDWYDSDRFTLVQSTGLKDKNGKKIFEGDIVKGKFHFHGVGWYDSGEGDYEVCDIVIFKDSKFTCRGFDLKDVVNGSVEVIGNIYENPELLKEGAK